MSQRLPPEAGHGGRVRPRRDLDVQPQAVVLLQDAEGERLKLRSLMRGDAAVAADLRIETWPDQGGSTSRQPMLRCGDQAWMCAALASVTVGHYVSCWLIRSYQAN